jgi:tetratricopeptide (TPR) repeat protein
MAAGNAQLDVTLDEVKALLEQPGLAERDRARLLSMQADVVGRQGDSRQALTLLRQAAKVEPDRAALHHQMAHYLRLLGERDEAARHVRKALRLTRGKVSSLPILLDASRLYDELGQRALARATRRELEESDVTGFYAINAILDSSR